MAPGEPTEPTEPTCPPGKSEPKAMDRLVEGLDFPMFIVTAAHDGERAGCLVGFTTQASIEPPRMLVCLSVENHTYRVAQGASVLAVHLLTPDQKELAALFGGETGDEVDKFAQCQWADGADGVPLLTDSPRYMLGRIMERINFGDHIGFLLEPMETIGDDLSAVLTFQQVNDLSPGHPA